MVGAPVQAAAALVLVPGAQALSIQQWSLSVVEQLLGDSAERIGLDAAVGFGTGVACSRSSPSPPPRTQVGGCRRCGSTTRPDPLPSSARPWVGHVGVRERQVPQDDEHVLIAWASSVASTPRAASTPRPPSRHPSS